MRTLTTFILTIAFLQLAAQSVDPKRLKSAFAQLAQKHTQANQRTYFELFPNSFNSFEKTFGFKNEKAGPLYDGHEYVAMFFALDSIPLQEQVNKWINISIGGHWDADAVNYFQHHLRPEVFKHVDLIYELLKVRPEKEIESFFYFFFSEIHPQYENIPKEFEKLKTLDNAFYSLLAKGHKRAIEDSGH